MDYIVGAVAGILLLIVFTRMIRHHQKRRMSDRLGIPSSAPPEEVKRFREEALAKSAAVVSEAAGLEGMSGIYGTLMKRAGIYIPWAASLYLAVKLVAVLLLAVALVLWVDIPAWTLSKKIAGFIIALAALWLFPDGYLLLYIRERRQRLQRTVPSWIDLHTTLVEGGMGFDAALARIITETQGSDEPIYKELEIVHKEMLVGTDRITALRRMAHRTRIVELEQVVAALIQADRVGAGIVNSLRSQGDMIRNKVWENTRAEAEKLPTKLLFPIALGILPMFFVLILMPLVLRLMAAFGGNE